MIKNVFTETDELILRRLHIEDVPTIYTMSQEQGMKKWMPDQVYKNEEEAREVVEYLITKYGEYPKPDKDPFVLGVVLMKTNELIGHVGLSPIEEGIESGYAITDNYQRYGYATKAVKAMTNWAFTYLNVESIWGVVKVDNFISCRVLQKSGFNYVTTKEERGRKIYQIKSKV